MFWVLAFIIISATAPAVSSRRDLIATVNNDGSNSTTMILPLVFNNRDLRRRDVQVNSRRHLGTVTSNARMPLHDDLLLNGYYTTRLWIGTPPQRFALIVDTGSTVTYVPCSTCSQCGNHQDPKFQPELSSTYHPVKCNIDCTCDNNRQQCTYERQYAEMSSSSGVLGEDTVSFGNQSNLQPQQAVFGCENIETGDLYSQHADGIMGLGRGELSIVDQLVSKGVISDSFSLCYGGMGIGGGAMVLGGISHPDNMIFTRSDPTRSPYYNIELREIHVAGKKLPLNPSVFDRKHGTVLDSGTTYAYLPEAAFVAFKEAFIAELQSLQRIPGPDPNYNDICFSGAGGDVSQLSSSFPSVEMVFGNEQKLLLSPENFLFRHSKVPGSYCLGVFQNGKDPTTLLGGIVVRNTLVTYDREHEKIGFWKTNCSELWERLQLPTPPSPESDNSSVDGTPFLAPSEPPLPEAPVSGDIKIGRISFSMLLNSRYSDLKPQISELANLIAKGLNLDASQVKLIDITPRENETLMEWAIFPPKPEKYMSNASAMGIISLLNGNHVNLPSNFGSYHILGWKTQPPSKWIWIHKPYVAAMLTLLVMFIFGLSAFGAWLAWRSRRSLNSYQPVDSAVSVPVPVAEQELQPLQK